MNNYGLRFTGKVERLFVSEYLGEDVVERKEEKRMKLPNIIFTANKSKINSIFCRKEDIFFDTIRIVYLFTKT